MAIESTIVNSDFVLGATVKDFEDELAVAEGCEFAVTVNNGTNALELTLRAMGIGPGDEVITTSFTFVATTFAILQTGATPVLIDIDPLTGLMDPEKISPAINKNTKAVLFVTLHGRVEYLDLIRDICAQYDLKFIIDAAQSHLGKLYGLSQASFCDAATLSFYPGKNLGALGEGGAVLTNSQDLEEKIRVMRDWGSHEKYNHVTWGGNFRLEALQCAFLRIKLAHLFEWTAQRVEIAQKYNSALPSSNLMKLVAESASHVYHIYAIRSPNRAQLIEKLAENQIGYGFHYPIPVHKQIFYTDKVISKQPLLGAELAASQTLSIPIFPKMTEDEIERVIGVINSN